MSTRYRPTGGLRRWLTTVDHADVGRLYLAFGVVAGLWGALDAMAIRTELVSPDQAVWSAATYDALFTTHGLTMLFFFATPVALGFANLVVPPLVGAEELAFPRLNALAFWLLPPALLLARSGVLGQLLGVTGVSPPGVGWTLYVPLARTAAGSSLDLLLLGLHLSGVSTIASAANLLVTIVYEREVAWDRLGAFTWSILTTAAMIVLAFPVLGSALVMLLLDRNAGTTFFTVEGGGPLLWQHLFWFFGHPEVYILVLPAMGIISHVIPQFSGRRLVGERTVVYSTVAIGILSFGVWAHHMFAVGSTLGHQTVFMAVSLAIAVPSAVKVFNWLATVWNGRLRLRAPLLFSLGAVGFFVVGGVTGVFLAVVPVDLLFHGSYYVVGHFHLVLVGTTVFGLFAGGYYWFPLVTGRRYDERLARAHFVLTAVGVATTFLPLLVLGLEGLPRRSPTYPATALPLHALATAGAYLTGAGQLIWLWNVVLSAIAGRTVGAGDARELAGQLEPGREWDALLEDRN